MVSCYCKFPFQKSTSLWIPNVGRFFFFFLEKSEMEFSFTRKANHVGTHVLPAPKRDSFYLHNVALVLREGIPGITARRG